VTKITLLEKTKSFIMNMNRDILPIAFGEEIIILFSNKPEIKLRLYYCFETSSSNPRSHVISYSSDFFEE
jgi:hypothetical protein